MLRKLLILILLVSFAGSYSYGQRRKLNNPSPSPEAASLYCYIQDNFGKKTLSGQMYSGWSMDEIAYTKSNTGKEPAIIGLDFISEGDNNKLVNLGINYWKRGGIVTFMYHMGAPGKGEGYNSSKGTIDMNRIYQEGTAENKDFWFEMKRKADHLQALRDAGVPVLWRPFHELNGGWFWWGKGGGAQFKKLWIATYNYMVNERKLNNLIWVLCYSGSPNGDWFPGNQYVDIAGADTYPGNNNPQTQMYKNVLNNIGGNKMPITYHETGIPPKPDQSLSEGSMWSWWMIWHTSFITDMDKNYLRSVYSSNLIITLDEVPNLRTQSSCGGVIECTATAITPSVQVDGGAWQAVTDVKVPSGSTAILGPQPAEGGSWSWTGCGATGTAREQTIKPNGSCTATATYTNTCGKTSTISFKIASNITATLNGQNNFAINLFPSPCTDHLQFDFEGNINKDNSSLQIYTIEGKLINEESVSLQNTNTINTLSLKPGVYVLKISNGDFVSTSKFSKVE